jgi:hypothetical protein
MGYVLWRGRWDFSFLLTRNALLVRASKENYSFTLGKSIIQKTDFLRFVI